MLIYKKHYDFRHIPILVAITADGIDMGGKKITNLGDGTLNENSTDAVNGGQLYAIANVAELKAMVKALAAK